MTMRKFLIMLLAGSLTLASCGKGKEAKEEEEGTDDQALQTATAGTTAATATTAAAPVSAEGATVTGVVKFQGAPPMMPTIQMSADPYCASQHASAPAKDEEV